MDDRVCPASVVIPTIGRLPLLRQAVESVLACRPAPAEVLVVDQSNGSEVARLIDELGRAERDRLTPGEPGPGRQELRRIFDTRRGIGRALNTGIRAAAHPFVLVTHDDCTVRSDWVVVAVGRLAERPDLLLTGRVEPAAAAAHVPSCKTDREAEDHQGGFRYDLLYCNNWAAARERVLELGGFDERAGLRLAAEDCDFCFRWTVRGRPVRYEPDLVVWHQDWRSEAQLRRTYRGYGRGLGVFYAKHLLAGHRELLRYLRIDLARGVAHSYRGRLRGEPPGFDVDRGLLPGVPVGLLIGGVEELRRRWAARRQPNRW
jgi:GT2 family glycosyltransferase